MSDGISVTIVGAIAAGIGSILTVVFTFLLKWRSQEKEKKADSEKSPKKVENNSSPGVLIPAVAGAGDTGRHQALADLSDIDWGTLQQHVAELAAQQPVTNAKFDESMGGMSDSVKEVRADVNSLKTDVKRVEDKLDEHIKENGKRHSAGSYSHVG
jgi:seryl-tRNA synthetase